LTYKVFLRDSASRFLESLANDNRRQARELALILTSLGKNPKPAGSRELKPTRVEPVSGGRIWDRPDWRLLYCVDEETRTVDVGTIEKRS
jgi:mRNA-degrading endonuclease RelE of RelBE toxin-antitoxin system